jgi:Zn-dependent protease with chaperone function
MGYPSVFERFDDSAKRAVALAWQEARAGGRPVGCEYLLLALCQMDSGGGDEVLAPAGLTEEQVRKLLCDPGHSPASQAEPAAESPKVAPHAGAVLSQATRQADGRRHAAVGSSHLLLAMVAAHPPGGSPSAAPACAVSPVMSDLKAGHLALVLRAIGQVNARYGERNFPYVGNEIAAALPVRNRRWVQPAVTVAGYAVLGTVALALSPAGFHRTIAAVYLLTGLIILPLLNSVVVPARVRGRLSRPDAERVEAPALASALAPARLDVFVVPGGGQVAGQSLGRAFRMWGRGTIILRPVLRTANPDLVRFITAHEAAHVARGDGLNATLAATFTIGLAAALAAGNPAALWLLLPALAAMVVNRWAGELACDRIAARATGRIPSLEFASYLGRARQSKKMTPAKRLRSLLTHPPASTRRQAIMRACAGTRSLFPPAARAARPPSPWTARRHQMASRADCATPGAVWRSAVQASWASGAG